MHQRRTRPSLPRNPSLGAARPAGIVIALATAVATFGIGMLLLPPITPPAAEPDPIQTIVPAPTPPPHPVAAAGDAASMDAATVKGDGGAGTDAQAGRTDASSAAEVAPANAEAPAATGDGEAAPGRAEAPKGAAGAHQKLADKLAEKDVAREAWRKNLPDVSVDGPRATMIIPIKGSIDGATYHVTNKPRSVLVTMPKAESMITMPFYNVNREGFRKLWIKKDDQSGTTTLRITLGGDVGDPQADIKDDYVRVTVRRASEAPADDSGK